MTTIRVSGVQMRVSHKLAENLPKILAHIETSDADFIVFPEMSLTGYHGDFSQKAAAAAWRQIATACRQAYVTALIGTGVHTDGRTYIQTRIKTDEGRLLGTQEKLIPTLGDREFCKPGEELRVFKHKGLTFGCLICNDLWVTPGCGPYPDPRLTYQLGQRGARIVFHAINSGSSPGAYLVSRVKPGVARTRKQAVHCNGECRRPRRSGQRAHGHRLPGR